MSFWGMTKPDLEKTIRSRMIVRGTFDLIAIGIH
jgi:hypothetical protein